jgi:hypothetical protein
MRLCNLLNATTAVVLCALRGGTTSMSNGYFRSPDGALGFLNIPGFKSAYLKGTCAHMLCRHCGDRLIWCADGFLRCEGYCDTGIVEWVLDGEE